VERPLLRIGHGDLERDGRAIAQRGKSAPWIVEVVDVSANGNLGVASCLETGSPDPLRIDGFESRLDHRVVVAISLAAHGWDHAGPLEEPLIVVGTVLAGAIGVIEEAGQGLSCCKCAV